MTVLLRVLKVKTFEETTIALLEAAVNTWLESRGEERVEDLWFLKEGTTTFYAVITYSEE